MFRGNGISMGWLILVGHLISFILARPGTPSSPGPPTTSPPAPTTAVVVCSSYQFNRRLLVSFEGRPGNVTDGDIQFLQNSFLQTYNNVGQQICGSNPDVTFRRITAVSVQRKAVISFGNSYNANNAGYYIKQKFTWVVTVDGICQGCDAQTFQFLADDPTASTRKSNKPSTCSCSAPRRSALIQALNQPSVLPNTIDKVKDITVLFLQATCPPDDNQFETFLAVNYIAGTNINASNQLLQNQLLAQSVLETYNDDNALNQLGLCDTEYHTLTNTDLIQFPIRSGRRLVVTTNTFKLSLMFRLRGKCRGCSTTPILFNDGVTKPARRLQETDPSLPLHADGVLQRSNDRSVQQDDLSRSEVANGLHRRLPIIDRQCYCPAKTLEYRVPEKTELIDALNDWFEIRGPGGDDIVDIASAVQDITQYIAVNCSTSVNNFTTKVMVGINANKTIPAKQLTAITRAFQTTYNSLAAEYCDPVFRSISTVKIAARSRRLMPSQEGTREDRELQKVVSFIRFAVQGQCLGCPTSTRLFDNSASRNLRAAQIPSESLPRKNENIEPAPESATTRTLLTTTATTKQSTTCYCLANNVAFTAPSLKAFLVAFNATVTALDASLTVFSASELK